MYKNKLPTGIAVIMIAIMAISLVSVSATTVSAVGTPVASKVSVPGYTAPTLSLTETKVRDNAWVLFHLTVNNAAGSENIDNVLVLSTGFTEPMGSDNVKEQMDNVADNLIAVMGTAQLQTGMTFYNMAMVRDNLLAAVAYIKLAGAAMVTQASHLNAATIDLKTMDNENVKTFGTKLATAVQYWTNAGNLLQTEPFNLNQVTENIALATFWENNAAENLMKHAGPTSTLVVADNILVMIGDNIGDNIGNQFGGAAITRLENCAVYWENKFAENLRIGNFYAASGHLENAALAWDNVSRLMRINYPAASGAINVDLMVETGNHIDNMVWHMRRARENLRLAAENIALAGYALSRIENDFLDNAENLMCSWTRTYAAAAPTAADAENLLIDNFRENIQSASRWLLPNTQYALGVASVNENIQCLVMAGDNLKLAVGAIPTSRYTDRSTIGSKGSMTLGTTYKDNFRWLGPELGADILGYSGEDASITNSVRAYIWAAADNLENDNRISITNAANALYNAGTRLAALGTKIKATAAALGPVGMGVENSGVAGTNGVLFVSMHEAGAITENHIGIGGSKTFTWLWKAPDISAETAYNFTVYAYSSDNVEHTITPTLSVTVDGQAPYKVTIVATVENLTDNNYAGRNNTATVTVTANEELSLIGSLYLENVGTSNTTLGVAAGAQVYENIKPAITLTDSGDHKTWTTTFSTTGWLDNWENLRLRIAAPWARDQFGLDNTSACTIDNFFYDVKPPAFIGDNGLNIFNRWPLRRQPAPTGTNNFFHENTIKSIDNITIPAEDNNYYNDPTTAMRRGWCTVKMYINNVEVTTGTRMSDNRVNFVPVALNEGNNTIKVRATDRAGNYCENTIENVFIDNTPPVVTLAQISKRTADGAREWVTWTSGMYTNDNRPGVRLKITDPGYPTTGWGVVVENINAFLDNVAGHRNNASRSAMSSGTENFLVHDNQPAVFDNGACTNGIYNWENIIRGTLTGDDSADNALPNATYYLVVWVTDNVFTTSQKTYGVPYPVAVRDNENFEFSFIVNVSTPTAPPTPTTTVTLGGSAAASTKTTNTSVVINGTAGASTTVKMYITTDGGATWTHPTDSWATIAVGATGTWTTTVPLTQGATTGIGATVTSASGMESARSLFGYATSDATAPTVTISSPTTGTATDKATIEISGAVTKDSWETVNDITATVQSGSATAGALPITWTSATQGTFKVSTTLSEGTNTVIVTIRDAAGNTPATASVSVERTVAPLTTYAIIVVVVALILAAIAIFRKW